MLGQNNPNVPYQMTPPNPAFMKWIHSVPTDLTETDLATWLKANPSPAKTPPPVSQAVADYIAEEVKKQVALALNK